MNTSLYTIYEELNTINGKTYIGKHKVRDSYINNPCHDRYRGSGTVLKAAKRKYGSKSFVHNILVLGYFSDEQIDSLERHFIQLYRELGKAEYNISDGGEGGALHCCPHSQESKEKMSQEKRKQNAIRRASRPQTVETRMKISKSRSGWKQSQQAKDKMSRSHSGKALSESHCVKISEGWRKSWKKIRCIELNLTFDNHHDASLYISKNPSRIRRCCEGIIKTCGQVNGIHLHWEFVD
jgi:group I intron endonuclease